jgi:ParB-like chromosome segregation protein Spo0J
MTEQPEQITIDPEFQNLIRPLTEKERNELRESLARNGLLSPLLVWKHEGKNILVDGHNRLSLWKEYEGFDECWEFKTQEVFFTSRDKVKEGIIKNQLGRRNLSPDDFKLLVGQLYNQRKKTVTNPKGNNQHNEPAPESAPAPIIAESGAPETSDQHEEVECQNDIQPKNNTADAVATETGVSPRTVMRAARLADAVEEIQAREPEAPREQVIAEAKKRVAQAKPKAPRPKLTLEEELKKRWEKFIKNIPVTNHTAVRLWLAAKLKEPAL